MDDEGFPLLQPGARSQPLEERQGSVDQESGETTRHRVMVLRRTETEATTHSRDPLRVCSQSWHTSLSLQPSPRTSQRLTLRQEFDRVPSVWDEDITRFSPRYLYQSNREPPTHVAKESFRVPQIRSEARPQNRKEVTITIWREFSRGPKVYEEVAMPFSYLNDNCLFWPHLQALFGDSAVLVPLFIIWVLRILKVVLKIFIPFIGFHFVYFHFLYVHLKIHMTGEKKGVHPVFIGEAYQGPMIYSIRHLYCPYCRNNKQFNTTLRYFKTLLQERQNMANR